MRPVRPKKEDEGKRITYVSPVNGVIGKGTLLKYGRELCTIQPDDHKNASWLRECRNDVSARSRYLKHISGDDNMQQDLASLRTYEPWHRTADRLGPGPNFTSLHDMRWASQCLQYRDAMIDLKRERCFRATTNNETLTSILFVVGACVVNSHNFHLLNDNVRSIRRFHASEDILVFDNCPQTDSAISLSKWLSNMRDRDRLLTHLRASSNGSLYEFGAFAQGVSFMLSKQQRYEYIVFLQHSAKLQRPIPTTLDRCPVFLQRPWALWGDPRVQHTEFITGRMYQMMYARKIPLTFLLEFSHSWISVGDGSIVMDRTLVRYLSEHRLLDSSMVDQCRSKGCFESVSGMYGMYAGLQRNCTLMHVHAITLKSHGHNK